MLDFLFGMIWKDFKFNIECCLQVHKVFFIEQLQSIKRKVHCYVENNLVALKFIHN